MSKHAAGVPVAGDAAQGVASGLSEPRAELIEDQPRGAGAGAASGVAGSRHSRRGTRGSEASHLNRAVGAGVE